MVAELIGGLISGSLALLADAGHMLTDVLALAVAFSAVVLGARPADDRRTYGYRRLEILAALLNGMALVALSGSILYEAAHRWMTPQPVDARVMGAVAAVGLVANLVGLMLLRGGRANLNVRGAFLHVLGDTLSSVGVLLAAAAIAWTGWQRLDPLLSMLIALVIIVSSFALLREVIDVLLEAAPRGLDTERVRATIAAVDGVIAVHDLHVWSITTGLPALSAHVVVTSEPTDPYAVLQAVQGRLLAAFSIRPAPLQIECHGSRDCGCAIGDLHERHDEHADAHHT